MYCLCEIQQKDGVHFVFCVDDIIIFKGSHDVAYAVLCSLQVTWQKYLQYM